MDEFEAVSGALNELSSLTASVEQQVKELREAASEYADACAHARKSGDKVPPFSGSAQQKQLDDIVRRLDAAAKQVGFIGSEMTRFGG